MTEPTPPSAPTPPPPAPMSFDMGRWSIFDKIAVGAGAVALLFSFFTHYVSVSFSGFGASISAGVSAWHSYAVLGMLLILAAVALVLIRASDVPLPDTVPWPLVTAGASGLGVLLLLIRGLTWSESGPGASVGIGWSGWIVIIAGVVLTAAAVIPLTTYKSKVEEKLTSFGGGSGA